MFEGSFFYYMYGWGWPLLILALVLPLIASLWTKSTFKRYDKIKNSRNLTGCDVAEQILQSNQLSGKFGYGYSVKVERVAGNLTDHYSPKEKVLRLSDSVYSSTSVAAIGVAAHECGHAIQDAENFIPNIVRGFLGPVANIGSQFGPYMAIFGVILTRQMQSSAIGDFLFNAGILFFFFAVLFYLVTLPVEINASHRALRILADDHILTETELAGARKVLTAAAMTYVAAAASAIFTLLRLLSMKSRR